MASDTRLKRIPRSDIPGLARSIARAVSDVDPRLTVHRRTLLDYELSESHADEPYAFLTCALALQGVSEGNGGIGCVLVDADGSGLAYGHNKVFHPYFRSDLHGEMVTMDAYEDSRAEVPPARLTLYSSLEPCPMCMVRLVTAGVGRVLYLARDEEWGMTEYRDKLPPTWRDLSEGKVFAKADCSPELLEVSSRIFNVNIDELYELLKNR